MAEAAKYHVVISAGPSYDTSMHRLVPVNQDEPFEIRSDDIHAKLSVRIQNFRGLRSDSPSTCSYFSKAPHTSDLYSIAFSFVIPEDRESIAHPTDATKDDITGNDAETVPADGIPGTDLLFGNDFANPIRDRLPPGFSAAFRIVRWAIDPGLDGDVQADKPYLYGPLLSSMNVLRIGEKCKDSEMANVGVEAMLQEGADGTGEQVRERLRIPEQNAKRMKYFLDAGHRKAFVFEKGREYSCDFYNGYLDFNEFALKLPGISLHLMNFWDGQPLRYVLKHKSSDGSVDKPLMVIVIALVPHGELEQEAAKWAERSQEASKRTDQIAEKTAPTAGAPEKRFVDDDID